MEEYEREQGGFLSCFVNTISLHTGNIIPVLAKFEGRIDFKS